MRDPSNVSAMVSEDDVTTVLELLANARANGHPMEGKPEYEIAVDMNRLSSSVEGWSHEYLVAAIRRALAES